MDTKLTVSLAQTTIAPAPQVNLQTAHRLIRQAVKRKADLIVFPEMFMALPRAETSLTEVAEPIDGPFIGQLATMAAEHGIAIICSLWRIAENDTSKVANVAVAIGPDGKLLAHYHKIHLFDALNGRESERMLAGDIPPPIFSIKGMQLGLAICYDLRFPELFRNLALRGADAVIVPSAWYAGPMKEEHWLTLLQARAIENTMYICGANVCGANFTGRTTIFDPFGVMLAGAGEEETLVSAELSRARLADVREKLPALGHRRMEIFKD